MKKQLLYLFILCFGAGIHAENLAQSDSSHESSNDGRSVIFHSLRLAKAKTIISGEIRYHVENEGRCDFDVAKDGGVGFRARHKNDPGLVNLIWLPREIFGPNQKLQHCPTSLPPRGPFFPDKFKCTEKNNRIEIDVTKAYDSKSLYHEVWTFTVDAEGNITGFSFRGNSTGSEPTNRSAECGEFLSS